MMMRIIYLSTCFCLLVGSLIVPVDGILWADDAKPAAGTEMKKSKEEAAQKEADKKDTAKGDTKKAEPDAKNPLANLIRNVFAPNNRPPKRIIPKGDGPEERKDPKYDLDDIDQRAPYDPELSNELRKAAINIQDERWEPALERLQFLLDRQEDFLVMGEKGKWLPLRVEANRLLGQMPEAVRQQYEFKHGETAKLVYDQAIEKNDLSQMAQVAWRFYHTEVGRLAANHLGTAHFNRGEYGLAVQWFQQLTDSHHDLTDAPRFKMKYAVALRRIGRNNDATRVISEIDPQAFRQVAQETSVSIDGPERWLESLPSAEQGGNQKLQEWHTFLGTPDRIGRIDGGSPLLLPQREVDLAHSHAVLAQMQNLRQDLFDQGRTPIPAWFPVMNGGRIAFRTMRGVQVMNVESGRMIWEVPEAASPEILLAGQLKFSASGPNAELRQVKPIVAAYQGNGADSHPLASLLYRDGTYGMLSCDNDHLYVLEDTAILAKASRSYSWRGNVQNNDELNRDWASNQLVAYDWNTGRTVWRKGGPLVNEMIVPSLAGYFFHGAPVPAGRELYLVGEHNNELRLVALDAATGRVLWNQLIGFSEYPIESDSGRRHWNIQVSIKDGIIICPTSSGWLVAVDRESHAILWAHRYRKRQHATSPSYNNRASISGSETLNTRWGPSAPIISAGKVLYTPREERHLYCVDLFTGERLWQLPKSQYLYLAGVYDGNALLVKSDGVTALSLETGTTQKTIPFANGEERPSGVGVLSGDRYFLPVNSGKLLEIDLKQGRITERIRSFRDRPPLENLNFYRGWLISFGPSGLVMFEQRSTIEDDIQRRRQSDPADPIALLREAKILYLSDNYEGTLETLRKVDVDNLDTERQEKHHQLMTECLIRVIRKNFKGGDQELQELESLTRSDQERFHTKLLKIEQAFAREQFLNAFRGYQSLIAADSPKMVKRPDNPRVEIRLEDWVGGRLGETWQQLSDDDRRQITSEIISQHEQISGEEAVHERERFIRQYGFHPAAMQALSLLQQDYLKRDDFASAANVTEKLVARYRKSRSDGALSADDVNRTVLAMDRLASRMTSRKWDYDAAYFLKRLHREFNRLTFEPTEQVATVLKERAAQQNALTTSPPPVRWDTYDFRVSRSGTNYSSYHLMAIDRGMSPLPFLKNHRLQLRPNRNRLEFLSGVDETIVWSLPVRTARSVTQNQAALVSSDHLLFLLHKDVLHVLSPVERRLLWTRPVMSRMEAPGAYRTVPSNRTIEPMRNLSTLGSSLSLNRQATRRGMLAIANSDYVCLYEKRGVAVYDAITGNLRWRLTGLPKGTNVYGNRDYLYVVTPDGSQVDEPFGLHPQETGNSRRRELSPRAYALRSADGQRVAIANLSSLLMQSINVGERGLVMVEQNAVSGLFGLSKMPDMIRLYDPLTKKDVWKNRFPRNTRFSMLPNGSLAALTTTGQLELIDLATGSRQKRGSVPEKILTSPESVYLLSDNENFYVVINQRRTGSSYYYSENIPSIRMNGTLIALNRENGEERWQKTINGQNMLIPYFGHSPVLMFGARSYIRNKELAYWSMKILMLDRWTGRELAQETMPSNGGYRSMHLNLSERYIDLRSYNERIRIYASNPDQEKEATVP